MLSCWGLFQASYAQLLGTGARRVSLPGTRKDEFQPQRAFRPELPRDGTRFQGKTRGSRGMVFRVGMAFATKTHQHKKTQQS